MMGVVSACRVAASGDSGGGPECRVSVCGAAGCGAHGVSKICVELLVLGWIL